MKTGSYDFLSGLMISLFNSDRLFTYDFLAAELQISRTSLSEMKKGCTMNLYQYLRVIGFILDIIHLTIRMPVLLAHIKQVIAQHGDLLITVAPPHSHQKDEPLKWVQLTEWNDAKK